MLGFYTPVGVELSLKRCRSIGKTMPIHADPLEFSGDELGLDSVTMWSEIVNEGAFQVDGGGSFV